jgi:hypothetical protein
MRTVILVPRRDGIAERDATWRWCKNRWQQVFPDVAIYEGHHEAHEGKFNRAKAVNRAAELATKDGDWDIALVVDSDIFVPLRQVEAAIETARTTGKVTWAHRRWRGLDEDSSRRVVADRRDFGPDVDRDDMDVFVERTNPISWSCCIAIPRAVWDDIGGFDERFVGWGWEDMAFQSLIVGLYGHERIEGDVFHLWHPRSEERIARGQIHTASKEYVSNARLGRRYMVALRRDHGYHDRADVMSVSPEEMKRDISNLKRDDEKLADQARRLRLPDWDGWWPTLEQLRDSAREKRVIGPEPTVTLIVHTDGRRDMIQQSIPSLLANLTGPIVKKVIYDDSGDAAYKQWLRDTFPEFFVVGPDARLGQAGSMRAMWKYLDQRCDSQFVFAVEDDFLYDRPVDLGPMMEALAADPNLRQMALLRDAYYPRELAAGSIINEHPEAYELQNSRPHPYLTHRLYFTFNPSLFWRSLTSIPMPGRRAETSFTAICNDDPNSRFGLWGSGEPWITHIGSYRMASLGY